MQDDRKVGFALVVDPRGEIIKIVRDGLALSTQVREGKTLSQVVDEASTYKSLNFLNEINTHGIALDWEINVASDDHIVLLNFTGVRMNANHLIVIAHTPDDNQSVDDEILHINEEQANIIRSVTSDYVKTLVANENRDNAYYDEISRLNNELLDTQHELIKRNIRLEKLILYDSLTSLYNRRTILEKLQEYIRHTRRYREPLSVMISDIDYFKRVNDTYGYVTGDEVLKAIARLIQENIRDTDIAGRYGGEEFMVVLPMTEIDEAKVVAERIRKTTEEAWMTDRDGQAFKLTISIGLSNYSEGDTDSLLVTRTDDALYKAKQSGRNSTKIITADDTLP